MGLSLQSGQVNRECIISMPESEPAVSFEEDLVVPWSSMAHTSKGVAAATKAPDGEHETIVQAIAATISEQHGEILPLSVDSSLGNTDLSLCLRDWYQIIASTSLEADAQHRAKLALVLTFMSLSGRQNILVCPEDLDFVWSIVHDALSNSSIHFTVSRSAQGFLAIPLWALLKDGNIDELFRLHVWLPDGKRGVPGFGVHPHQSFAQSWILTGKGRNSTFEAQDADPTTATHAEYALAWSDSNSEESGKTYQVHQRFSTVVNTGKLVRVMPRTSEVHSRNETYIVPSGVLHSSKVDPDILHATLFFFDSSRGFQQYAPILGPINGQPYVQRRDPAGITASALVQMVESVRTWELLYNQGIEHVQIGDREEALRAFRSSSQVYSPNEDLLQTPRYRRLVLREIESIHKVIERDGCATTAIKEALYTVPSTQQQIDATISSL